MRPVILAALCAACSGGTRAVDGSSAPAADPSPAPARMELSSPAFAGGGAIPARHTADGEDSSPPLRWTDPPVGTAELALTCHDPDAPRPGGWAHWILFALPPSLRELPGAVEKAPRPDNLPGAVHGKNDFGALAWGGPSPPRGHGLHHYHFVLYALDRPSGLRQGATLGDLESAVRGHVLGRGELVGTYERR